MKNLVNKFRSLNGAKIIGINFYESVTSGEIANHRVNVNISVKNAKESDLKALKALTDKDLIVISDNSKIALDVLKTGLAEMITSAEKNLSANFEDHTNQSKGQSESYFNITPAIRVHIETMTVHIFGQAIDKTVLVKGTYKEVNSSAKTLGKKAITKFCDLKANKFRDFILGQAEQLKVNGDTIEIVRL
jgi:hypothetical protein